MADKQYSPVTKYLFCKQPVIFGTWDANNPATNSSQVPFHKEGFHSPRRFTGPIRPIPANLRHKPYIPVNQALISKQENFQFLPRVMWNQRRSSSNQVVTQSQGRPNLEKFNQEKAANVFDNKTENSITTNTANESDWTSGKTDYHRDHRGYSAVLKRPRPITPMLGRDNEWQQSNQNGNDCPKKSRKINTYKNQGTTSSVPALRVSPQHQENIDNGKYFKPLTSSPSNTVELHVTNLDQNIDSLELKEILLTAFKEHVMVLHLSMFVLTDGNLAASVKIPSVQDAQYAISQLHRRKVGQKRIMIAYAHSGSSQNPQFIRSQIYSLLSEVPGYRLPLFTFRNLFESRYLTSLSVSELYRMRDVCIITDENTGRTICLNPEYKLKTSPRLCTSYNEAGQQNLEVPHCIRHGMSDEINCEIGWAEQELPTLPNIRVKLSVFSKNIQALIHSHNDFLPLASLMNCHAAEIEPLVADETGVPLEHLVTWVPNVELSLSLGCVKYLHTAGSKVNQLEKPEDNMKKCASPSLAKELSLFSRELVDLLRTQPKNNQLMFNRFIPAYHHHFGRQCRVADYGFTKLIDLFEALPHVIQVIGEGNKRIITLSHRAQIRRFTSDLLRVLKFQPNKQLKLSELGSNFESTLGRPFDPVDYGLCYLEDLLEQLSENIVVVSGTGPSTVIAIPKREQTAEEIDRTKQFALEVVELLSHAAQCSMLFSKFTPAYHHHYGYQCRVSDYGFIKLIDLFEAIPHIVQIEGGVERERRLTLANDKKLIVLSNQVVDLVNANYPPGLPISALGNTFLRQFGYALKPAAYGFDDLYSIIEKLQSCVKISNIGNEPVLTPIDQTQLHLLSLRIFGMLMVKDDARMPCLEFYETYQALYKESCSLKVVLKELKDLVLMTRRGVTTIELTNLQLFARNIYKILYMTKGQISCSSLESTYLNLFGTPINPVQYNHQTVNSLLQAISHVVRQGENQTIILNEELESAGIPLPQGFKKCLSSQANVKHPHSGSCESINGNQVLNQMYSTSAHYQNSLIQDSTNSQHSESVEPTLVINLPEPSSPPDPEVCASFMSPYKALLPATIHPFCYSTPLKKRIISPHPSELPLPQSYFINSNPEQIAEGDESTDSGLVTSSADLAPDFDSISTNSITGISNNGKRKTHLAARFDMPLE